MPPTANVELLTDVRLEKKLQIDLARLRGRLVDTTKLLRAEVLERVKLQRAKQQPAELQPQLDRCDKECEKLAVGACDLNRKLLVKCTSVALRMPRLVQGIEIRDTVKQMIKSLYVLDDLFDSIGPSHSFAPRLQQYIRSVAGKIELVGHKSFISRCHGIKVANEQRDEHSIKPFVLVAGASDRMNAAAGDLADTIPDWASIKYSITIEAAEEWVRGSLDLRHDPYLVILDSNGISPVANCLAHFIRKTVPKTRILLWSDRVDAKEVVSLQNDPLSDKHVPLIDGYADPAKGKGHFLGLVKRHFDCYCEHPVLSKVREQIEQQADPSLRFMTVQGRGLSLLDVYWHIARESEIGKIVASGW